MQCPYGDFAMDLEYVAKTYRGRIEALRGIAMQVHVGEIFGLLGPNGAGKSTLVKILMTTIRATRCRGTVLGATVGDRSALERVGYLPEHLRFPEYLTGGQVLDYFGALAKVPRQLRRRRAEELLDLVGMSDWRDRKVSTYSKGMRQRLGMAQALINDPDLLLLDEPTDGVDPAGRREIRTVLSALKERGKTVFLNSHLLSELEMVCDRVAILSQGKVVRQGTIEELTRESRRYEIELASLPPDDAALAALLTSVHGYLSTLEGKPTVRVPTADPVVVQPLIDELRRGGVVIESIRPVRQSLEDYFIEVVGDAGPGASKRSTIQQGSPSSEEER